MKKNVDNVSEHCERQIFTDLIFAIEKFIYGLSTFFID